MDEHRDYFYATNFVYSYKRVELDDQEKESLKKHKALRWVSVSSELTLMLDRSSGRGGDLCNLEYNGVCRCQFRTSSGKFLEPFRDRTQLADVLLAVTQLTDMFYHKIVKSQSLAETHQSEIHNRNILFTSQYLFYYYL